MSKLAHSNPSPSTQALPMHPFKTLLVGLALCLSVGHTVALEVIEASLPRTEGSRPVVMRGLLDAAPQANGKLLMVFPGWPGIPRIELKECAAPHPPPATTVTAPANSMPRMCGR
jgi:hypothetical protein